MSDKLKQDLIRLGSQKPELQEHLKPILDRIAFGPGGPPDPPTGPDPETGPRDIQRMIESEWQLDLDPAGQPEDIDTGRDGEITYTFVYDVNNLNSWEGLKDVDANVYKLGKDHYLLAEGTPAPKGQREELEKVEIERERGQFKVRAVLTLHPHTRY